MSRQSRNLPWCRLGLAGSIGMLWSACVGSIRAVPSWTLLAANAHVQVQAPTSRETLTRGLIASQFVEGPDADAMLHWLLSHLRSASGLTEATRTGRLLMFCWQLQPIKQECCIANAASLGITRSILFDAALQAPQSCYTPSLLGTA